jgi:hypothetical protein
MEEAKDTPYVVRRRNGGWEFVPSSTFVGLMVGAFGASSVFLVYLSTLFFRSATSSLTVIPLLVAGICAAWAIRAWRTRKTPLNVESGGRVSYGKRQLCAAGTVRSVRIVPARGGEVGDCEVWLEQADGKLMSIPSQYFAGFKSSEHAKPFAKELAKALGVEVTESRRR